MYRALMGRLWLSRSVALVLLLAASADARCLVSWQPPVANTDSSAVLPVVSYRLWYLSGQNDEPLLVIQTVVPHVTLNLACRTGFYYVTVVDGMQRESVPSNTVEVTDARPFRSVPSFRVR